MVKVLIDSDAIDWEMLRGEKESLLETRQMIADFNIGNMPKDSVLRFCADMDGIIHLLDYVQDQAAEVLGELPVFGPDGKDKGKPLTLVQLLDKANEGYPNNYLANFYDPDGNPCKCKDECSDEILGDGLAEFIVREIAQTFDSDRHKEEQIGEALRVIRAAISDLEGVAEALSRQA
ncbi:MAG: hypothetical protein PHV74_00305 [Dehalococcoidia bacterium]|nr:hypothetical protein [Dehalococcoidia bacterium]